MKRIAYTHREFRLCEWPEEPNFCECSCKDTYEEDCIYEADGNRLTSACRSETKYRQAVTSAMENGVRFDNQEQAKRLVWTKDIGLWNSWQPKEGENWPAPEGAEIKYQEKVNGYWIKSTEGIFQQESKVKSGVEVRKVAVLKVNQEQKDRQEESDFVDAHLSESVEKKENWIVYDRRNHPQTWALRDSKTSKWLESDDKDFLQSIADRLNQGEK